MPWYVSLGPDSATSEILCSSRNFLESVSPDRGKSVLGHVVQAPRIRHSELTERDWENAAQEPREMTSLVKRHV